MTPWGRSDRPNPVANRRSAPSARLTHTGRGSGAHLRVRRAASLLATGFSLLGGDGEGRGYFTADTSYAHLCAAPVPSTSFFATASFGIWNTTRNVYSSPFLKSCSASSSRFALR